MPRWKPFYGWYIVGVALVAQFVSAGTQGYVSGVFLKAMTDDLGWSRESFSVVQTLSNVVMGSIGFFIGGMLDRRGPRILMFIGAIIAGASMIATSFVETLWQFYLLRGITQTIGMALIGNLIVNVTVAKWFVVRRGMAIALASVGVSMGGVLMTPLAAWWVDDFGWRTTWVILGIMTWVLTIPSAYIIRRTPEDAGLLPDGMTAAEATAFTARTRRVSASTELHWRREEAIRTPTLWLLIVGFGSAFMGVTAIMLHGFPLLTDSGFSDGEAAVLFGVFAWAALIAKFVWAPLMDRFHARYLSAAGFAIASVSIIGLVAAAESGSIFAVALALSGFGFGTGGIGPLQETVWASYFGRAHLGEIRSVGMPFSTIFGGIGPLLGGVLYERTGSYTAAFLVIAGFAALAFVLMLFARPPVLPARLAAESGARAVSSEAVPPLT